MTVNVADREMDGATTRLPINESKKSDESGFKSGTGKAFHTND
jgi:hypothetical protein